MINWSCLFGQCHPSDFERASDLSFQMVSGLVGRSRASCDYLNPGRKIGVLFLRWREPLSEDGYSQTALCGCVSCLISFKWGGYPRKMPVSALFGVRKWAYSVYLGCFLTRTVLGIRIISTVSFSWLSPKVPQLGQIRCFWFPVRADSVAFDSQISQLASVGN